MKYYRLYFILTLVVFSFSSAIAQNSDTTNSGLNERQLRQAELDRTSFEIYPNPATDYINIEVKEPELMEADIKLYDIIGNRIQVTAEEISKNKYRLEIRELPMGYYVLIINDPLSRFKTAYKFSKR